METNSAAAFLVADAESRQRSKQLAERSELEALQRKQAAEQVEAAALQRKKDAEIAEAEAVKRRQAAEATDAESRQRSEQLAERSELEALQRNQVVEEAEAAGLQRNKDAEIAEADSVKSQQMEGFPVQVQSSDFESKLRSLTCDEFVPGKLSRYRPATSLFDIPDINWTQDTFAILRERALSCVASASPSDGGFVKAWLKIREKDILARAETAIHTRDAAIMREHAIAAAEERRQAEVEAQGREDKAHQVERGGADNEPDAARKLQKINAVQPIPRYFKNS